MTEALFDVALHLPGDLPVLVLYLCIDDGAPDEIVADVLPKAFPHDDLAEHLRPGVLVLPEIVVADDPRDLLRYGVAGGKVARDYPGGAGGDVDVEKARLRIDGADLLIFPAVMVAPFDPPPVRPGLREPLLDARLVTDIRYAEKVAPARRAGHGIQEREELADRRPDGEDAPIFPPVDGIAADGVEVVVREMHNGLRPPGKRLHEVLVPDIPVLIAPVHW